MTRERSQLRRAECIALGVIMILFAVLSIVGITWGLPTRKIDKYLFGDAIPWSGETIYGLANADEKFSPSRGADVDVDPVDKASRKLVLLTATEQDTAKIYLRYRLYTHQPDEMITMMALAGMRPGSLDLDPRLYQYGGLFIYPVGALIKLCGVVGLIDVRSDVPYYLEHPGEFGKFYVVARAYSALWGLLGVWIVFAIARRLGGFRAATLAALLFAIMPVVVCMAHEGKPHLPGAVLMLLAVLFAMRHRSRDAVGTPEPAGSRDWWLMCVCCGAAFGMVLSSWPIFVLIPLVALLGRFHTGSRPKLASDQVTLTSALQRTVFGTLLTIAVYLITNPYILINTVTNREVLQSNFGNSLAMYEISRIGEGFVRVIELTIEGAALPILALGVVATVIAVIRRNATMVPLAVAAAVFFMQFVFIGAGKPGEYGRFGIFTNTALAIGAACLLTLPGARRIGVVKPVAALLVILWTGACGGSYLRGFKVDTSDDNSRTKLAQRLSGMTRAAQGQGEDYAVAVLADPAPYGCPPMNFSSTELLLVRSPAQAQMHFRKRRGLFLQPEDKSDPNAGITPLDRLTLAVCPWAAARSTSISWANKPFLVDWPTGANDPTAEE
jgi:hypothetical protein